MAYVTGLTSGGNPWTHQFLQTINWDTYLGCGRCFKTCGRGVMALLALDKARTVADEDDDEIERKVMAVVQPQNCIGCQACDRACPKRCHTYTPALA